MSGSGIQSQGADLDAIFAALPSGETAAAATGISVDGNDLNQRFAPLSAGSAAGITGIQSAGADLNTIFAAIGTATYALPCDGDTANANTILGNSQTGSATASFTLDDDGTYALTTLKHIDGMADVSNVVASGTWNTLGGASSDYQARYTFSAVTQDGTSTTLTNGAPAFAPLSSPLVASVAASGDSTGGSDEVVATLTIELARVAGGVVFSTTTVHLHALLDGSV